MSSILEIKDLSFGYNKNKILNNINLVLKEGEFSTIMGENGSGKSTLMKLIIGELQPDTGSVDNHLLNRTSYIPQLSGAFSLNFPITVQEILALNLIEKNKRFSKLSKVNQERIKLILEAMDMVGMEDVIFKKLSGGQRQKVMIGKALIDQPKLLLLDEPLIGLDEDSRNSVLSFCRHLSENHKVSILLISHDKNEIKKYSDNIYSIKEKGLYKL